MKKLARAVIKEELVALTGNFKKAIVLNQMIYWSERRKDADQFLIEEIERMEKYSTDSEIDYRIDQLNSNGWIYKKAEELSDETMIGVKPKAMREYLKELVDNGWLQERRNPHIKMDRTLQYRVNLLKIQLDLNKLGYALEGYNLPKVEKENTNFLNEQKEEKARTYAKVEKENRKVEKENTTGEKENRRGEKEKAIPKITTKTSTKTTYKDYSKSLSMELVANIKHVLINEFGYKERLTNKIIEEIESRQLKNVTIQAIVKQARSMQGKQGIDMPHLWFVNGLEWKLDIIPANNETSLVEALENKLEGDALRRFQTFKNIIEG